jgi:hypothetical protein
MSFQYTCGRLNVAPPGPMKTEYGKALWKWTYGKLVSPIGKSSPTASRSAVTYRCACAYLPS